ncbi:MAG: ATP-binding protein [Actinomycetota bacterium]
MKSQRSQRASAGDGIEAKAAEPSGRALLQARLMGRFELSRGAAVLSDRELGSRKQRLLLKLLLLHRDHYLSNEFISEVLWGEVYSDRTPRNLATLVSRLRTLLGAESIEHGESGYRLIRGAHLEVDLDVMERAVAESEARRVAGESGLARSAAERALELASRGPLLEDEPYAQWATPARASAERLVGRARRSVWQAALVQSDFEGALTVALAALEADPLDEESCRAAMVAYHNTGRSGQALAHYESLRATLAAELGADPAPETRSLHLSILRSEPLPAPGAEPSAGDAPGSDPAFVGRSEEVAHLTSAWEQATWAQRSLVLITGEAGIGKTRLAAEIVSVAQATGGLVLHARCYEAERSLFLQPLCDALRTAAVSLPPDVLREVAGERAGTLAELVPEIGFVLRPLDYGRATPDIERRRAFEAVASFLRSLSMRRPVLVFLDDLHNAGSSTLELLHFAVRRMSGARVLLMATLRAEEGIEVITQLDEVSDPLTLGPLPDYAVSELARHLGVSDLAGRITDLTRGHTLFVVETLRALSEGVPGEQVPVPASLRDALLARVRRAGSKVEDLLRVAAVLGSAFDLAVAARMLEVSVEEAAARAERARNARLLVEAGKMFEFANDLVREILYRTTPLPTRIARHQRAAQLSTDNPEAVAVHSSAAEDWASAARAWLLAGRRAAERFANADAERMLNSAMEAASWAGDLLVEARARLARGRVREALAHFETASEDHAAAVSLARALGDRALEMEALRELGGDLLVGMGRPTVHCIPYLERALPIAVELEDSHAEISILGRLAVISTNRLRFDIAYSHARRAVDRARSLGDENAVALALDGLKTVAAYAGDLRTLEPVVAELESLQRRQGRLWHLQWTVFESSFVQLARGRWDEAVRRIDTALELNRRTGYHAYEPMFTAHLGWIFRARGDYGRALSIGRESAELAAGTPHPWWAAFAETMLGWTLTDVYSIEEAIAHLARAVEAADRNGVENYLLRSLAHLALARATAGDAAEAESLVERAGSIADRVAAPEGLAFLHGGHAYVALARARLKLGDPDGARTLVGPLLVEATRAGWKESESDAALVLGLCLRELGDTKGAWEAVRRALGVAEEAGLRRIAFEAHRTAAALSRDSARPADARRHDDRAAQLIDVLASSIEGEARRAYLERSRAALDSSG